MLNPFEAKSYNFPWRESAPKPEPASAPVEQPVSVPTEPTPVSIPPVEVAPPAAPTVELPATSPEPEIPSEPNNLHQDASSLMQEKQEHQDQGNPGAG